jgi:hypothetical protein
LPKSKLPAPPDAVPTCVPNPPPNDDEKPCWDSVATALTISLIDRARVRSLVSASVSEIPS